MWCVLCMYVSSSYVLVVAVTVGNIQGKSRFTVAEIESKISTAAEAGILVSH